MFEKQLYSFMKAYHRMETPICESEKLHEQLKIYDIEWDEDDLNENPELRDIDSTEMAVVYFPEYEGDTSNRTDEIERQFREEYGCVPITYETEILNAETIKESIESKKTYVIKDSNFGFYLSEYDKSQSRYKLINDKEKALQFDTFDEAERFVNDIKSQESAFIIEEC